ncbi:hypothetical protein PG991_008875 [Apiospora marii]|uniref:Uncharacterized protein n=1 Tax=Apiospora marii TaxID=335849 RepID=A0ABR1RMA9_9PEZI
MSETSLDRSTSGVVAPPTNSSSSISISSSSISNSISSSTAAAPTSSSSNGILKVEFQWPNLGLTGSGPTGIPPVVSLLVSLGLATFLWAWVRRLLLSSEKGRRVAGALRLYEDETIAAAAARAVRLSPAGQDAARRRHIAFCDAAVAATAAAHQLAPKVELGTPAGWLAQGYLRAAEAHSSLAFAEEEKAGDASEKALAAAAAIASLVGVEVEGDAQALPPGPQDRHHHQRRSSSLGGHQPVRHPCQACHHPVEGHPARPPPPW